MRRAGLLVGQTSRCSAVRSARADHARPRRLARTHPVAPRRPNFQLVPGYAHTLCTSVNDEVYRHPVGGSGSHRGRPVVGRLRRGARRLERRRGLSSSSATRSARAGGPAPHRRHRGRPLGRHSALAVGGRFVCGGRGGRGEHQVRVGARRSRLRDHRGVRRARDRPVHDTRIRRSPTTGYATRGRRCEPGSPGRRAMVDTRPPARPASSPTTGRSPPSTGPERRTGSTRSP